MNAWISKQKFSHLIPGVIVSASLCCGLIIGTANFFQIKNEITKQSEARLSALVEARKTAVEDYLKSIEEDLVITASNQQVIQALDDFKQGWQSVDADPTQYLQGWYINKNPNKAGEKDKLDMAPDGSNYSQMHAKHHPWFHNLQQTRGYYDVFLVDTSGNVVYTVFKELDFATNLNKGQWKNSDLANVFKAAQKNTTPGKVSFVDFKPYEPSNGVPASFIATPVYKGDTVKGYIIFQMPIDRINQTLSVYAGLGSTGKTHVIGNDYYLRNDSRFEEESTILKTKMENPLVDNGLKGNTGIGISKDYRNQEALIAFSPLDFNNVRWLVTAEQNMSEVNAPLFNAALISTLLGLAGIAFTGFGGFWVARNFVVNPLSIITEKMAVVSNGDYDVKIPYQNQSNELGTIASTLETFRKNGIEKVRLEAEAEQARESQRIENERKALQAQHEADLARQQKEHMETITSEFQYSIESMLDTVSESVGRLKNTAIVMSGVADQGASNTERIATSSETTLENVENVNKTIQEMKMAIDEISQQVNKSMQAVNEASFKAANTNQTSAQLIEATGKIGNITNLITDIAGKINLLALNATIEAASAGAAGQGFAVVAHEVKELALQTSKATEQIAEQIQGLKVVADNVSVSMGDITTSVESVKDYFTTIASAVEEQSSIVGDIASSMDASAQSVQEVNTSIDELAQGVRLSSEEANKVLESSEVLSAQMSDLEQSVSKFLGEINSEQSAEQAHEPGQNIGFGSADKLAAV